MESLVILHRERANSLESRWGLLPRLLLIAALSCFILLHTAASSAARVEVDHGTIESISDGRILIQGTRGNHVLEMIRDCTWCEERMHVTVKFIGYGRATIRPKNQDFTARPLPVIVVKDGREEE
jgi:hypothetical protein